MALGAVERDHGDTVVALVDEDDLVAAYLAERGEASAGISTLRTAVAAIAHEHGSRGAPSPAIHPGVRRVLRGIARRQASEGRTTAEAVKQVEVTEQTYYRWRNQYGAMEASDARRLRELERENGRLKRLLADKELEIDALREVARGNW